MSSIGARAASVALTLALLAGGCTTSPEREADEKKARGFTREALETRASASVVASAMAVVADQLVQARRTNNDAAAAAAHERLKAGDALLSALEDAEFTFAFAERFFELRETMNLGPHAPTIEKLAEIARGVKKDRVVQYARAQDAPALQKLSTELERDRALLKAYRIAIGLAVDPPGGRPGQTNR
jgi:hypothetical protein